MKNLILLILTLTLYLSSSMAQKPNLEGFKNLKWGMSETDAFKALDPTGKGNHCGLPFYGGIKAEIKIFAGRSLEEAWLYFYQDKLCMVTIYFNDYDYSHQMNALVPKNADLANSLFNEIKSEINEKYFPCVVKESNCRWTFNDGNFIVLGERKWTGSLGMSYVNQFLEGKRIQEYINERNKNEKEMRDNKIKDY